MRLAPILLAAAIAVPAPSALAAPAFPDAKNAPFAVPAIALLSAEHVVQGFPDGTFRPLQTVTRAQFAAMLARLLALKSNAPSPFHDVGPSYWAKAAITGLYERQITLGLKPQRFGPTLPLTRLDAVVWLARALKLPAAAPHFQDDAALPTWAKPYIGAAEAAGITEGDGGRFLPAAILTRAQAAAFLLRTQAKLGPGAGTPMGIVGNVKTVLFPANANLTATSPVGGQSGSIVIGSRTVPLAKTVRVFRGDEASTLYGIGAGDRAVLAVNRNGEATVIVDVTKAAPAVTVRNASQDGTLYLSSGQTVDAAGLTVSFEGRPVRLQAGFGELVGDGVTLQGRSLTVHTLAVHDLTGTVTSLGKTSMTVRLTQPTILSDFLPDLHIAAEVTVQLSPQTTFTSATPGSSLRSGDTVTVLGTWSQGAISAGSVLYAP